MRVALFITCFNDTLFPETGRATVGVLERLGHEVVFPEAQTCCGQMHFNTGYQREAIPLVRCFVDTFEPYEAVVAPSGRLEETVKNEGRAVAFISGPSATSDIELNRVEGVHGPRALEVLIVG